MLKRLKESRKIEPLSAYLDDQLKPADRQRLEARIRQDPALQQELATLRRTRLMVRSLPARRAPRNFILTSEMAAARQVSFQRPVFGMVSALAILLLVFILIGDYLLIPGYIGMFPVNQAQPEDAVAFEAKSLPEAEMEPLVFPTEQPTQTEELSLAMKQPVEEPVEEVGSGGGLDETGETKAVSPEEGEVMADSLPEPAPSPSLEEPTAVEESLRALEAEAPSPDEEVMATEISATKTLEAAQIEATEIAAGQVPDQIRAVQVEAPQRQGALWMQVVFWMAELLLASIAIGAGLVALYTWIRQRS